jgi:hypothetical protein
MVTNEQVIDRLELILVDIETMRNEIESDIWKIKEGKYTGEGVANSYDANGLGHKVMRQLKHLRDNEKKWQRKFGEE